MPVHAQPTLGISTVPTVVGKRIDEIQAGVMAVHDALGRIYFLRQYDTQQQAQS